MEEMSLYDLAHYYARHWLLLLSAILIGVAIGLAYVNLIQTPMFRSEATILITETDRMSTQDSVILNNYAKIFQSNQVLESVVENSNYNKDVSALRTNTSAINESGSDIITVSVTTDNAKTSRALLEGSIHSFQNEIKNIYGEDRARINVVNKPSLPLSPFNVSPVKQVTFIAIASLSLVSLILFFMFDTHASKSPKKKQSEASELGEGQTTTTALQEDMPGQLGLVDSKPRIEQPTTYGLPEVNTVHTDTPNPASAVHYTSHTDL